jgi:hypothetical protein
LFCGPSAAPDSGLAASVGLSHLAGVTLSVRFPDELIAVIPHLLGFQPEESIVFLPLRSDLPVARVDTPTTPRDHALVWRSIRDGLSSYAQPGSAVGIVCITADRALAKDVGQEFAAHLDTIGIDTRLVVWADAARERIAAPVLTGRAQSAASRDSLATSLVADREPVARLLPETRDVTRENTAKLEGRWAVARMQRFQLDGIRLSNGDAARLLVAIESIPTGDRLWLDMNWGNAASHVALWKKT